MEGLAGTGAGFAGVPVGMEVEFALVADPLEPAAFAPLLAPKSGDCTKGLSALVLAGASLAGDIFVGGRAANFVPPPVPVSGLLAPFG